MTLKDIKIKTFSLIEEYYPELSGLAEDEDVLNKINGVINSVQMDLMQFRKIPANDEFKLKLTDNHIIDLNDYTDLYQVNKIILKPTLDSMPCTYNYIDPVTLEIDEGFEGTVTIYYYKYPKEIKLTFKTKEERDEYDSKYKFDIDRRLLEIMPYGIARDLLRLDMISNYGSLFERTYNELIQRLDSRRTTGYVYIEGGID